MKVDLTESEIRFIAIMIGAGMSIEKSAEQIEILEHLVQGSLRKLAESVNEKFIQAVVSNG